MRRVAVLDLRHAGGRADRPPVRERRQRVVICEKQFFEPIRAAAAFDRTAIETVVCVDADAPGTVRPSDVEATPAPGFDVDATWQAVQPGDVLTIIYTSGTTGPSTRPSTTR
ncbi:hypothetical protein [uncultured Jatrophihabitans sp.]|uniref:hypothetical protein n=1 Tax=uncultured Jatrophihabitans sp. TaxID=1610747 RepID=UPI0035CAD47D